MGENRERNKKGILDNLRHKPEVFLVCALFFLQAAVFLIFWDRSYPQIHDNLDLFPPHYRMMKLQHAWFAHGVTLPVMHGLNRDLFGSEFLLYNLLYILLPDIAAYILGYFLKIAIGFTSFLLLARDMAGRERYRRCLPVLLPVAAAFAMIPVFPTYGIAFTSVPLVVFILRRIFYRQELTALGAPVREALPSDGSSSGISGSTCEGIRDARRNRWSHILPYIALFCYPALSYFSYHGFFILCYLCVAVLILWIRDRKFPLRLFLSVIVLSLGYVAFEYRLFGAMLLDHTVTIRTTMEHGELTLLQALWAGASEFVQASFHNQDSHTVLVLPATLIGLIVIAAAGIRRGRAAGTGAGSIAGEILTDPAYLLLYWIIFNCLNFGLYQYAPYRHLLETLVPKLTGFEFARTAYFNTFLWYALLAVLLCRLFLFAQEDAEETGCLGETHRGPAGSRRYIAGAARALACLSAVIVMFLPQVYNDFYYTVYNHAYILLKHKETSRVNYREYYSRELFARILREMDYHGEWSAAYGMHPAILNYNGIASLDGYIGFYPQSYKETWERVEAPAFAGSPWLKDYFEGWGARVCLYSGSDENTYDALRYPDIRDTRLMADIDELAALDCRYIFSRIRISNAEELGLREVGRWSGTDPDTGIVYDCSPYEITVYELPRAGGGTW